MATKNRRKLKNSFVPVDGLTGKRARAALTYRAVEASVTRVPTHAMPVRSLALPGLIFTLHWIISCCFRRYSLPRIDGYPPFTSRTNSQTKQLPHGFRRLTISGDLKLREISDLTY
jgi:hypothetical protein